MLQSFHLIVVLALVFIYLDYCSSLLVSKRGINRKLFPSPMADNEFHETGFENPPFFPTNLEELAKDASFAAKVALINNQKRIRIDVRMRITGRSRNILRWLLLMANEMLDDEIKCIRVFIDSSTDLNKCQSILNDIKSQSPNNSSYGRIFLSPLNDTNIGAKDQLFVLYNPNNIWATSKLRVLDEVQALCFHSALKKIPILLINPLLMATAWSDGGIQRPLLMSDFTQAYFVCDDYCMISTQGQWCGLVQRALTGVDLFVLEGLKFGNIIPKKYSRLYSWKREPDDMNTVIARLLLNFPFLGFESPSLMPGGAGANWRVPQPGAASIASDNCESEGHEEEDEDGVDKVRQSDYREPSRRLPISRAQRPRRT